MNATESVRLNIWNEYDSYTLWSKRAQEWLDEPSTSQYWTEEESARYNLADEMKEYANEHNPLATHIPIYSNLLQHALDDVDWQEIADEFIQQAKESRELEAV